ncbi:MAG TPA: cysteine desulfurase family protein [Planctomycetota bacterium]|nr:cysteine desulfurase family protein [Planctomycetota bacterium]
MIYLDNASTTRIRPEARDAMASAPFANPSSIHAAGRAARKAVEDAREAIADLYGGDPKGITFTSGATEADNLAIFGVADALRFRGNRIIVSAVEHPAVLEAAEALGKRGFEIVPAPVDHDGRVDVAALERQVTPATILISVMAANNEVGTIQPVDEIADLCRDRKILFHCDAAQAAGKIPFRFSTDLATISSHKMHGPRGAGALYVKPGTPIASRQVGGGQEFERRAGTEAVDSIVGFAAAARSMASDLPETSARVERLRARLESGLRSASPMKVQGHPERRLPHILSVAFEGCDGEAVVIALDAQGLCVSSGSACASQSMVPSHVLRAMGRSPEETRSTVRFSLGWDTTEADVDAAIRMVPPVIARLRAIAPAGRP